MLPKVGKIYCDTVTLSYSLSRISKYSFVQGLAGKIQNFCSPNKDKKVNLADMTESPLVLEVNSNVLRYISSLFLAWYNI